MAYRIFLSHTSADADLVNHVERAARNLDIETYKYEDDLFAGSALSDKLIAEIEGSDALVALLTRAGSQRPAISLEVGCALSARKPIIAVVESGVDFAGYTLLQGREYVQLDRANPQTALLAIQDALRKHRSAQSSTNFLWAAAGILAFVALRSNASGGSASGAA